MKTIIVSILLFNSPIYAQNINLSVVRNLYQKAATEEYSCKKLIDELKQYSENNNPTLGAYKAAATIIMAKHLVNPIDKLSSFNQGKSLLEKCIKTDTKNIEMHYLRFTIQKNSPSFLGYTNSIDKDKTFLINSIDKIKDMQLKQLIISCLKTSEYLTSIEKQKLK